MTITVGSVLKDDKYLGRITRAIKSDLTHPRHHGVKMQAHHIISAKGVSISGLGDELVGYGYDINELPNLVFLPCTLQGACHLTVQVHRGNHTAAVDQDKSDNDRDKPINYHTMVAEQLADLKRSFAKECSTTHIHKVVEQVNEVSKTIVRWIQRSPRSAPLTDVAQHFVPGSATGCGGVSSVTVLKRAVASCPVERNHYKRQAKGQSPEGITYRGDTPYKLRPGK